MGEEVAVQVLCLISLSRGQLLQRSCLFPGDLEPEEENVAERAAAQTHIHLA